MNREQRRRFVKNAGKQGMSKENAQKFLSIADNLNESHTPRQEIHTGDIVILKTEELKARKNYGIMNPKYREFIERSDGVRYTAVLEREELIHLEEEPKWLFWCGDMDVVVPAPQEEEGEDTPIDLS